MAAHREYESEATIQETPEVSGGYPCIGATRIPMRTVVQLFAITNDINNVMDELPQRSGEQIEDALAYYHPPPAWTKTLLATRRRLRSSVTTKPFLAQRVPPGGGRLPACHHHLGIASAYTSRWRNIGRNCILRSNEMR